MSNGFGPSREPVRPQNCRASPLSAIPADDLHPRDIIRILGPQLTAARLARLEQVCATRMEGLTVVLESLYDEGNRSAVYRSAEAFGLMDVHVINPDATSKRHARAVSRGAEKWLRIHEYEEPEECILSLRAQGFRVFVSDLEAARPLGTLPFDQPTALVFGSEHSGITPRMRALADGAFIIPMRGFVESLNVSTAAAITIAHARTERERALGADTDLTPEQREELLAVCIRKSARAAARQLELAAEAEAASEAEEGNASAAGSSTEA